MFANFYKPHVNRILIATRVFWGVLMVLGLYTVAMASAEPQAVNRAVANFDNDWRFSKGDFASAMLPQFDDSSWRQVNLPHDWSSEGPFSADYSSGTGFAPGGIGWYRKHFKLEPSATNKVVTIEFDGIYDNSEVWINGHFAGGRPYGYSSFECAVRAVPGDNVVAVRVDHSRFADSRWYTGSGIYRHTRLVSKDKLHIAHWGTYVTTPEVTPNSATVQIETTVENVLGTTQAFSMESVLCGPDGQAIANVTTAGTISAGTNQNVIQQIKLHNPRLWSPEDPTRYTIQSKLAMDRNVVDECTTPFGVRTVRFDPDKGFLLNGKSLKLKGVCIHHDAGTLGAAVPEKVLERRLRLLQEIGVNAIRTSHNPPAPELLEMCDRLGLLVKDEAFDEFTPGKNKWVTGWDNGSPSRFGYSEVFKEWSVTDISDMVRRDRNHPCIIMWSIGNEIDFRNDPFTDPVLGKEYRPGNPPATELVTCAKPLVAAVKKWDSTRPVTAALATVAMSDAVGLPELLDIVGYNYQEDRYPADHKKYPKRVMFGSENGHGYAQWLAVRDNEYISGQFLWTGIDYLGEAGQWPNRANGAGLLDLCGFKKPNAWFRQSLWSDKPMVYLCAMNGGRRRGFGEQESWNWPSNSTLTVRCFTTSPEVMLMLNDRPVGTNYLTNAVQGVLSWQVPFEPGTLKAIGRKEGKTECEFSLRTAGAAQKVELIPDVKTIRADGRDICHVELRVVDAQGVRVPDAASEIKFTVEGPAKVIGIENGDVNSSATGKEGSRAAYHGRGLAIMQSTGGTGTVRVKVEAAGLAGSTLEFEAQP